jgi:hypothetical protein
VIALLLAPFLPVASREILGRLGTGEGEGGALPEAARWGAVPLAGRAVRAGAALFPRIEAPEASA